MTRPLTPQENRVRCYHEAGHALLAFRLGVKVKRIVGGDIARTVHDPESYATAPTRVRALLTLAGAVAEELTFGERSPGCCKEDLAHLEKFLGEMAPCGPDRDALRIALEDQVRAILKQPAFRAALDVLAQQVQDNPDTAGRWAVELLGKSCPDVLPHLQVRRESYEQTKP